MNIACASFSSNYKSDDTLAVCDRVLPVRACLSGLMSTAPLRSDTGLRVDRKASKSRPEAVHISAAAKTLSTSASPAPRTNSSLSSWWKQPTALYSSFVDALPGKAAFSVPRAQQSVEPVAFSKTQDQDVAVDQIDTAARSSRTPVDKVCHQYSCHTCALVRAGSSRVSLRIRLSFNS